MPAMRRCIMVFIEKVAKVSSAPRYPNHSVACMPLLQNLNALASRLQGTES